MSDPWLPDWFKQWLNSQTPQRSGLGTTFKRIVRSLILPSNAGPNDPRIVIGPDVPSELTTYYLPLDVPAAILFYSSATTYGYIAAVGTRGICMGFVRSGDVGEVIEVLTSTGNLPELNIGLRELTWIQLLVAPSATQPSRIVITSPTTNTQFLIPSSVDHDREDGPARTTAVAGYANMTGLLCTADKCYHYSGGVSGSNLDVCMHCTLWSTAVSTGVYFGVLINGVDYDVCKLFINPSGQHMQVSGTRVITGLAAGSYSVQGRWRRFVGAGTLTQDSSDYNSMNVREIPTTL